MFCQSFDDLRLEAWKLTDYIKIAEPTGNVSQAAKDLSVKHAALGRELAEATQRTSQTGMNALAGHFVHAYILLALYPVLARR